ncbi:MAG TPA: 1-deoxy-D-xylulose-5-phosphate synthase [Candidatus Limnocylindrales bacterium]|nr:1-deoxy-D-xylulose-5-phosphate synthase [Candidatus Limnocylindrales bacterium]
MPILDRLQGPADLRGLTEPELEQLAGEIRETIIRTVAATGGHLGSSLGVVEITLALHRLLESPRDRIVWDTGHQAYAHKLLTGRLDRFQTLRQIDGIGGFPRRTESEHDVMDGGHAGTGLSIAEGLATARDIRHSLERIAVVVGDAALLSGLSLEALNDIGHRQSQLLIVLNDNEMSISPSVGALSKYLSEIKLSVAWQQSKGAYDRVTEKIPVVGPGMLEVSKRFRQSVVSFAQPGQLFEDLGITYIGVMPGHDLHLLEETFRRALALNGPVIVHVRTQKGKGYTPAEIDQVNFHGAALPPMPNIPAVDAHDRIGTIPTNGDAMASSAADGSQVTPARAADQGAPPSASVMSDRRTPEHNTEGRAEEPKAAPATPKKTPNYTAFFAKELVELGETDRRIVAITAGMPTGTGLNKFQAAYPDRFIDVGIAEQHAVTLATGLALAGMRPVVALYSTFLQRAFDQTVHDVCQNDAPVLLAVDRAGLVGEDGTSHQGMFTVPAQRMLPNLVIASPKDEQELRSLLRTAFAQDHPFALHYPRDAGFGVPEVEPQEIPVGRGEVVREGRDILFVTFGPITYRALEVADALEGEGWSVGVLNARWAKPLDRQLILDQARGKQLVVTFEESVVTGGFGSAVLEAFEEARLTDAAYRGIPVRLIGIPGDRFVDHGAVTDLRRLIRLDVPGLTDQVRETIAALGISAGAPAPNA